MDGRWIFDRKAYEAALSNVAASNGAEVLSDHICTAGRHGGGWTVRTSTGRSIVADFVGWANGRIDVARYLPFRCHIDRLVGDDWCAYAPALTSVPDGVVHVDSLPWGWMYAPASPEGVLSVTLFTEGDQKVTPSQRETLLKESLTIAPSMSALLRDVQVKREYRGRHSAVSCFRGTSHGARWIAVGDAAQTVDPLSSGGIGVTTANAVHGAASPRTPGACRAAMTESIGRPANTRSAEHGRPGVRATRAALARRPSAPPRWEFRPRRDRTATGLRRVDPRPAGALHTPGVPRHPS
jgi:flavin-dependent dehydrogenase